jgi:hypothetical protein
MTHEQAESPSVPRPGRTLRVLAFLALVAHLQAGSFAEQVLHVGRPETTMSWEMFGGTARDTCATEWFEVGPDGAMSPFDRLGTRSERPQKVLLRNAREVEDAGRRLCRLLGGARDVRVHARCGTRTGRWEEVATVDRPLCVRPPQKAGP